MAAAGLSCRLMTMTTDEYPDRGYRDARVVEVPEASDGHRVPHRRLPPPRHARPAVAGGRVPGPLPRQGHQRRGGSLQRTLEGGTGMWRRAAVAVLAASVAKVAAIDVVLSVQMAALSLTSLCIMTVALLISEESLLSNLNVSSANVNRVRTVLQVLRREQSS